MKKINSSRGFIHFILLVVVCVIIFFIFDEKILAFYREWVEPTLFRAIEWIRNFVSGEAWRGLGDKLRSRDGI